MYNSYTQDFLYDVPANNLTVIGYEFNIMQSQLELEDNLLGLYDNEVHHDFIDIAFDNKYIKA
jgi:hypothetical protein